MIIFQYLILLVLFIWELAALVSFGYWGFQMHNGILNKIAFGIGTPLLVAIVWGSIIAPKAPIQVGDLFRLLLQIVVFGLAALALYSAGRSHTAIVFIAVGLVVLFIKYILKL